MFNSGKTSQAVTDKRAARLLPAASRPVQTGGHLLLLVLEAYECSAHRYGSTQMQVNTHVHAWPALCPSRLRSVPG